MSALDVDSVFLRNWADAPRPTLGNALLAIKADPELRRIIGGKVKLRDPHGGMLCVWRATIVAPTPWEERACEPLLCWSWRCSGKTYIEAPGVREFAEHDRRLLRELLERQHGLAVSDRTARDAIMTIADALPSREIIMKHTKGVAL